MILVLIVNWLRFFSYFLVIDTIARLTITLFNMIYEAVYYIILFFSYFLLMTTIFTILFRNSNSDAGLVYENIFLTFRSMFDYTLGNFNPVNMGNYNYSFTVMYMTHTFISTVFLLNYLVAIL